MTTEELLSHAQQLRKKVERATSEARSVYSNKYNGLQAQVCELLRITVGEKSSFFKEAARASSLEDERIEHLNAVLEAFIEHIESGLHAEISPERRAQIDVVSDFLDQAYRLLENKKVHPAPAAVLIGASLEEFLRTWIEAESLSMNNRKPSLQNYAQILYKGNFITRQDIKDITAWGGIRNHAAHGEWEEVSDKSKVDLMLQGVNLFMRKYGA